MKKLLCGTAAALTLAGAAVPAIAAACNGRGNGGGEQKVTFCHSTSSTTNPYVKITTAVPAAVHHIRHHDGGDVVPAFTYRGKTYGDTTGAAAAFVAAGCPATVTPPPPVDDGGGDVGF